MLETQNQYAIEEIKLILTEAREKVARTVNNELLLAYWNKVLSRIRKSTDTVC